MPQFSIFSLEIPELILEFNLHFLLENHFLVVQRLFQLFEYFRNLIDLVRFVQLHLPKLFIDFSAHSAIVFVILVDFSVEVVIITFDFLASFLVCEDKIMFRMEDNALSADPQLLLSAKVFYWLVRMELAIFQM